LACLNLPLLIIFKANAKKINFIQLNIGKNNAFKLTDAQVIEQTNNWIKSVVIGCNFCPFAAKALLKKSIRYTVLSSATVKESLAVLAKEFKRLDNTNDIETTFIIFPNSFTDFDSYLKLVDKAERFLSKQNYDGIYQLASFHPQYRFAGSDDNDPANYTNRSIYPMLHILREDSITRAIENFPNPESIPECNVDFARQKGLKYMQLLRAACMD
jgi:hypothetical protein